MIALALAAVGLYGVMTLATERRMPELGVRLALGARPGELVRMVVADGILLALVGTLLGITAALWLSRLLTSMLYDVTPTDPATYVNIALLMLAVAALAAWLPARRAVRRDPLASLRTD